ncbi:MAG: hypothetical protein ACW972_03130, partial [Promethearchaeota archaeon]
NAGYSRLGDGYRFDIDLVGLNSVVLESIKAELDPIGIRCNIVYGWMSELFAGNFDIFILEWAVLMDPSITKTLLHTSGDFHPGGYSNSEIDLYITMGQQTPVRQEREYYYSQVQRVAQEDAPLLLMQETKKIYLRSTYVAPFVKMSKDGRIVFNFSNQTQDTDLYSMEDIEIASDPIYFPFTDGLVTLKDQQIEGNMTMTHELGNLIPDQKEVGKFYELQVNNSDLEYQLQCYYDLDEIDPPKGGQEQEIFQWNYSSQSWDKREIIASDSNLRFSAVQLNGSVILRLGQVNLLLLTFRFLPIIVIIIGPIITLSSLILFKNRKLMKKIEEEYENYDI